MQSPRKSVSESFSKKVQIRMSQMGPSAFLGGYGVVLWVPQAETFTR